MSSIRCLLFLLFLFTAASAWGLSATGALTLLLFGESVSLPYALIAPIGSAQAWLIDEDQNVVHTWTTAYRPGLATYLLANGALLRTCALGGNTTFSSTGGAGGRVELIEPDGAVAWGFDYSQSAVHCQHHDVEYLPNGNLLLVVWEYKTEAEALAAGRRQVLLPDGELWPDSIVEIEPQGTEGGAVVWQWRVWDHLIQDADAAKPNYGDPAANPGRIDLNHTQGAVGADWTHINSVDYNEELDQILVSVRGFSEIWIIDHAASTAEAAGEAGDLLYRWGNPAAHGASGDQQLFVQHDAEWIPQGYPGEDHILIFNNGQGRPEGNYSSVVEIEPPLQTDGSYAMTGDAWGPSAPTWEYSDPANFYADHISGAQRLPDGNTLICEGVTGRVFEVDTSGETVWEYQYSAANPSLFRVDRYDGAGVVE